MSSTRLEIEEECLRILSQRDEAVHAVPIPLTTTTIAADNLSVRALPLGRGTGHANRFDGCHVKVAETVASGPAIGEIAAVDDGGFDNTDKLTTSPAFSAAVQTGTDLFLYPKGLTPEYLIERINSVLRHTDYPYIWAPSLVTDADFDSNDLTNWPADGTPTTRAFITTAASIAFLGERALSIVTDATSEGAQSGIFRTDPDEMLIVQVSAQVTQGAYEVRLVNESGQGVLKAVSLVLAENRALSNVIFTERATGASLTIRFISTVAASSIFVSPPVIVQSQNRRQYLAPSWLSRKEQIKEAVRFAPQFSIGTNVYGGFSHEECNIPYNVLRADISINQMFVEFAASDFPVYFVVMRPFAELATDTATSTVDKDYVAAKTVANILRDRKDNEWIRWASKASKIASIKGYGQREISMVEKLTC